MIKKIRSFITKHPKAAVAIAVAIPFIVIIGIPVVISVVISKLVGAAISLALPLVPVLIVAGLLQAFTPIKPFTYLKNFVLKMMGKAPKEAPIVDSPQVSPGEQVGAIVGQAVNYVLDVKPSDIVQHAGSAYCWTREQVQQGVSACQSELGKRRP